MLKCDWPMLLVKKHSWQMHRQIKNGFTGKSFWFWIHMHTLIQTSGSRYIIHWCKLNALNGIWLKGTLFALLVTLWIYNKVQGKNSHYRTCWHNFGSKPLFMRPLCSNKKYTNFTRLTCNHASFPEIHIYMHPCVLQYMHLCTHAAMDICIYATSYAIHGYFHTCIFKHLCIQLCIYLSIHATMFLCILLRIDASTHISICVSMWKCIQASIHICVNVSMNTSIHRCMYLRIYGYHDRCPHPCIYGYMYQVARF